MTKPPAMSHTPGPWETDGLDILANYRGEKQMIASAYTAIEEDAEAPEAIANANLIIAAPDLLEACIALQMEAAARGCGLKIADDAISKARGQQ